MRVFVTGASGWIGSAVVPELIGAGHQVIGLARSDASADALAAAGAEVQRGDLEDLDSLRAGAAASDGVIHLAFIHDFSQFANSLSVDQRAIETIGAALEGSDRPLVIASGTLGLALGRAATEDDRPAAGSARAPARRQRRDDARPRISRRPLLRPAAASDGARRRRPRLHGGPDRRSPASRASPATSATAPTAGPPCTASTRPASSGSRPRPRRPESVLHAVDDEGVPLHEIAEVIGRQLDLPVVSVPEDEAVDHFGWLGRFLGADATASSALTRRAHGMGADAPRPDRGSRGRALLQLIVTPDRPHPDADGADRDQREHQRGAPVVEVALVQRGEREQRRHEEADDRRPSHDAFMLFAGSQDPSSRGAPVRGTRRTAAR